MERPGQGEDYEFLKREELPDDFAQNILNLELQIENGSFTIKEVDSLIYLYSVSLLTFSKGSSTSRV